MSRIGRWALQWADERNPWTNVYGAARTVLALSTMLTLVFSHSTTLFRPAAGVADVPQCEDLSAIGLFCLLPRHELELSRWLAVLILVVVASGWRPRFTGLLHWWVSFSLQASAMTLDGGDQVTAVLTLLLLPVTLTDRRRWHWGNSLADAADGARIPARLLALSALLIVRLQVAGIYFHASTAKFAVRDWANGTALYYWWIDPMFGAPQWLIPLVGPLVTHKLSVVLLTWGSMLLEVVLFMALVMSKRAWSPLLVLGIGFHAGIALVQGLVSFSLAMMGALLLYLRPLETEFSLRRMASSHRGRDRGAFYGWTVMPTRRIGPVSSRSPRTNPSDLSPT